MSFSVVMPIHNERKFLLYSLPSIIRLDPNEIVLIFDRCDDDSFIISKNIIKQLNFSNRVVYKTVLEDTPKEWVFRVAWLRRMAFLSCKNDWILNTDSDIVLNPKIKNFFSLLNKYNMLGFSRLDIPYSWKNFIGLFITHGLRYEGFSGTYIFSKRAWLKTDELNNVKIFKGAEDTHMRLVHGKNYKFCKISNLNLRPTYKSILKGELKWSMQRQPFIKVLSHSIIYGKPKTFQVYMRERLKTKQ